MSWTACLRAANASSILSSLKSTRPSRCRAGPFFGSISSRVVSDRRAPSQSSRASATAASPAAISRRKPWVCSSVHFPEATRPLGLVEVEPGVAVPAVGQSHGAEAEIDVGVIGELGRGLLEHPTARGGLLAGEEQAGQDHPRRRPLGVLAGLLADQAERLVQPPRAPPPR